jgi:hypothetical protein
MEFVVPENLVDLPWEVAIDTAAPSRGPDVVAGVVQTQARSVCVLRAPEPGS